MSDMTAVENMKLIATVFFAAAVLHTFAVKKIISFAHRFKPGSVNENLFHFLGEMEIVFGVWVSPYW